MTTKKKKGQTAPIDTFAAAFLKLMKCTREEIDIRLTADNDEALALYKEKGYKISTRKALRDYIEFQLTDKDAVQTFNLSIWIEVTENTVSINRFLPNLVGKIQNAEQALLLHLALGINSFSEDQYEIFWKTLDAIDKEGILLGNAILSAREVYDGDGLLDDLTEVMILNGKHEYNMYEDGIFEIVYMPQSPGFDNEFYIYSSEI